MFIQTLALTAHVIRLKLNREECDVSVTQAHVVTYWFLLWSWPSDAHVDFD